VDLNPPIPLTVMDLDIVLRLGTAALIGLALGLDRELRGLAAGLRTHGIVCFASAALTVSVLALYVQLGNNEIDPLRLYEAVGAFAGIIGAALVVFSKGEVKNVTTAAHLWLTAVAGMACGAGQWPLVAIAAVISLVLLTVLGAIEHRLFAQTEGKPK
jgi:putative Mg2+ transporter-C (MgtC) family protein